MERLRLHRPARPPCLGRNGGSWNGRGIISSSSAPNVFSDVALVAQGNTVVLHQTYAGDANLDGIINGDHYFLIDSNYGSVGNAVNYQTGDFNYDGRIDADDYFLIDANYGKSQSPLAKWAAIAEACISPDGTPVFSDASLSLDDAATDTTSPKGPTSLSIPAVITEAAYALPGGKSSLFADDAISAYSRLIADDAAASDSL